jgi:hypothetical protein
MTSSALISLRTNLVHVSDYGLDDWAIEVPSPTGAEDFSSSPCVQTGFGAHPASYPVGTGGKAWLA